MRKSERAVMRVQTQSLEGSSLVIRSVCVGTSTAQVQTFITATMDYLIDAITLVA